MPKNNKNKPVIIPREIGEKPISKEAASLKDNIAWRIFRIMSEFVDGFQFLSENEKEVTIFGSARLPKNSQWYKKADDLAYKLGKAGYTVVTGGGPGIMEAANKGAFRAKAPSVGINIQLPLEQRINQYVNRGKGFHYFFTRKVMLAASAQSYIFFPGGFGTLDEFFEIITLIQTEKMQKTSVICFGSDFWQPVEKLIKEQLAQKFKTISAKDTRIFKVVDNVDEAVKIVKQSKERDFF